MFVKTLTLANDYIRHHVSIPPTTPHMRLHTIPLTTSFICLHVCKDYSPDYWQHKSTYVLELFHGTMPTHVNMFVKNILLQPAYVGHDVCQDDDYTSISSLVMSITLENRLHCLTKTIFLTPYSPNAFLRSSKDDIFLTPSTYVRTLANILLTTTTLLPATILSTAIIRCVYSINDLNEHFKNAHF